MSKPIKALNYEFSYTKFPWGKYRDKPIRDIPDNYLHWVIQTVNDELLAQILNHELNRRARLPRTKNSYRFHGE